MESEYIFSTLVQKYFGFLVTEYEFVYIAKDNTYKNSILGVRIEHIDYVTPAIIIRFLSEPKFTSMDISWILKEEIDHELIDKNLLEDNLVYFSTLLRTHIVELMHSPDKALLKGLKRLFINTCNFNGITKKNFATNLNTSADQDLRKYYYYIKKKDRLWDPEKDL